jgi:hypothetical protein
MFSSFAGPSASWAPHLSGPSAASATTEHTNDGSVMPAQRSPNHDAMRAEQQAAATTEHQAMLQALQDEVLRLQRRVENKQLNQRKQEAAMMAAEDAEAEESCSRAALSEVDEQEVRTSGSASRPPALSVPSALGDDGDDSGHEVATSSVVAPAGSGLKIQALQAELARLQSMAEAKNNRSDGKEQQRK